MAELALAWTLTNEAVTSAIIGPRTMDQLESCINAMDVDVTDEDLDRIDQIVPPGTVVL